MERKRAGKTYNDEFKKTIVDLYYAGNSVNDLSNEYGVSEVTIYKWVKAFTPISSEEGSLTPKELAEIKKENLRLKQELDRLKKAMAVFAKKWQKQRSTILSRHIKDHTAFRKCAKC
ncbi:transposase [Priestia koreensis]|uniref:transposase n=1 Tax=Priestia koreensis TaxID=284581 RepID=UPI003C6E48E2